MSIKLPRVMPVVAALLLLVVIAIFPACSAKSTLSGTLLNGQNIFTKGIDSTGVVVKNNSYMMMGRNVACADCHGQQGHGGTVTIMMGRYDVPNITWAVLTGLDFNPPFNVDTVKRAIAQGLDESGEKLKAPMPQWTMSEQDLADLVSYIQTLK